MRPVMTLERARRRRPAVDRQADRLVAVTGIALAIGFLLLALLIAFLPSADRSGLWPCYRACGTRVQRARSPEMMRER